MTKGMAAVESLLVLVRQDGRTQDVPLSKDRQIVGRHTDCQIRVPIAAVSRHHCEIAGHESSVTIRDLGASNGTFVNGVKIEEETPLSPGDVLLIGTLVFVVRIGGEPATVDPEAAERMSKPKTGPASAAAAAGMDNSASASASGLLDDLNIDPDGSSVGDFDFEDLLSDEDDDDQPKL